MGTSTQTVLRQAFLEALDDWKGSLDCSGNGGAAGATLVDTGLKSWDGGNDDYYNGWWVKITSGDYSGNERLVSDYATSTGTITPAVAFAGQILQNVTYEIMHIEPAAIRTALNQARKLCYPYLYKKAVDECANVTGNWLWNSHFEDYTSTAFDHMATSGTPTMTQEATIIRGPLGTKAAKFVGGSAAYMYQSQVENPSLLDLAGQRVSFYAWAWASAASKARLQIYTKTSAGTETTTSSSYHSGGSEYEQLSIEDLNIPDDLSDIQFRWVNTDATVYFDNSYALGPRNHKLHLPKAFAHDPDMVEMQIAAGNNYEHPADDVDGITRWKILERGVWRIQDDATNRFLVFNTSYPNGYKLKLTGRELLSSLSTTESDTMEIANEEIDGLIRMAVSVYYRSLSRAMTGDDVSRYAMLANELRDEAYALMRGPSGMKAPFCGIRRF